MAEHIVAGSGRWPPAPSDTQSLAATVAAALRRRVTQIASRMVHPGTTTARADASGVMRAAPWQPATNARVTSCRAPICPSCCHHRSGRSGTVTGLANFMVSPPRRPPAASSSAPTSAFASDCPEPARGRPGCRAEGQATGRECHALRRLQQLPMVAPTGEHWCQEPGPSWHGASRAAIGCSSRTTPPTPSRSLQERRRKSTSSGLVRHGKQAFNRFVADRAQVQLVQPADPDDLDGQEPAALLASTLRLARRYAVTGAVRVGDMIVAVTGQPSGPRPSADSRPDDPGRRAQPARHGPRPPRLTLTRVQRPCGGSLQWPPNITACTSSWQDLLDRQPLAPPRHERAILLTRDHHRPTSASVASTVSEISPPVNDRALATAACCGGLDELLSGRVHRAF